MRFAAVKNLTHLQCKMAASQQERIGETARV